MLHHITREKIRRIAKQFFGAICLAIGFYLAWNLSNTAQEIIANAQGFRDFRAVGVMGLIALMLIGVGGLLVFKPDSTERL